MRISKQPDIRKQELLDIGVSLYFEMGEKKISVQKVVEQANVATGLFYYYFKSKDDFLDEALNQYVENQFVKLFKIYDDQSMNASQKIDQLLNDFIDYVMKMKPYRDDEVFKTVRHLELTQRLIHQLLPKLVQLLKQGNKEKILNISHVDLTAIFILNGLQCAFDSELPLNNKSKSDLKQLVRMTLGI